jgi:hypothetical protein
MRIGLVREATNDPKSMNHAEIEDGAISPGPLDSPPERNSSMPDVLNAEFDDERGGSAAAIAFPKLPTEVIQKILWLIDAESFASISLINIKWYKESQRVELYAHHVSRCPSFALSNNLIAGPFRKNDLLRFKTKFAAEVRRNLFEAYLRPRETLINLISMTANSSAAFPGGEAFRFSFSPGGQTLLALSSSRIFVIDLTADPPVVSRELKTLRRPLSASITDDGSVLAVLSTKHQANIYALTANGVRHVQVLVLDNPPRTIALAHEGTVLAAAYDGGVEVFSLAANAMSTDRRAVRCEGVDSLVFSGDGSMLIGSSYGADDPNTVVISAPFYTENDPDLTERDLHSRMWTTQILFPNNSSTCSHAALLPNHAEGDSTWLFAFDHTLSSYRAVRTDDTRTGVVYFLSPPVSRRFSLPSPSTIPTASECGDLVVAGFMGTGLWLYGVPGNVNQAPDMGSVVERQEARVRGGMRLTSATGHQEPLMAYSPSISNSTDSYGSIEDDSLAGKVDWRQSLFVKCRHLKSIDGLSAANWVNRTEGKPYGYPGKRLVEVAPGGVNSFAEELGDEPMPVDGGRLMVLDFDYAPNTPANRVITIEVGEKEPDLLREHHGDHEVEVALERRRTVRATRNRGNRRLSLGRSATAVSPPSTSIGVRLDDTHHGNSVSQPSTPADDTHLQPFSQRQGPSSQNLHRATTAAAGLYTARYPPRAPLSSNQGASQGHIIYPRNGRQIPNESDADNWEPPPPPYVHTPPGSHPTVNRSPVNRSPINHSPVVMPAEQQGIHRVPVPSHARNQQRAETDPVQLRRTHNGTSQPVRASTTLDGMMVSENAPARDAMSNYGAIPRGPHIRGPSDTTLDTVRESDGLSQPESGVSGKAASQINSPVSPQNEASYFGQRRQVPQNTPLQASSDQLPRLSATITHPISPPTPDHALGNLVQNSSPVLSSPASSSSPKTITLSGSNLQNRLNHPVPPPPSSERQQMDAPYIPPTLQSGQPPPPPVLLPQNKDSEPFVTAPPTADQMANLHRRMSQEGMRGQAPRRRPLSVTTSQLPNGYRAPSRTEDQDFARVPPSPPRAAWGAAGVPGSPSFNKIQQQIWAAPNTNGNHAQTEGPGLDRAGSRRGGSYQYDPRQQQPPNMALGPYSAAHSNSTPDILQRPKYGRLDTIDSVASERPASRDPPHDPFARPNTVLGQHSHSEPDPNNLTITGQQASIAMRIYDGVNFQNRGELSRGLTKKEKKRRKKREVGDVEWTLNGPGKKDKEGKKCVVM